MIFWDSVGFFMDFLGFSGILLDFRNILNSKERIFKQESIFWDSLEFFKDFLEFSGILCDPFLVNLELKRKNL